MKSKFLDDFYVNSFNVKKKDKFGRTSKRGATDKFGNSIRIGDLVHVTLKDGTILNECEVLKINNENILSIVTSDEVIREIHSSKVTLLTI